MVTEPPKHLLYRGAKEIAIAARLGSQDIAKFVAEEGLPAWQRKGGGVWFALPEDLIDWVKAQRDKYIGQ